MKPFYIALCLAFSLAKIALAEESSLSIVCGEQQVTLSLSDLRKKLPLLTWTIADPVYKKEKTYDGYLLKDILALAKVDATKGDELIFQALDGYAPTLAFQDMEKHEAMVSIQEHGNKQRWQKLQQGKAWISPAPFYLIWKEGKDIAENFPWSYQLTKIELVSFQQKYAKLFPSTLNKNTTAYSGFLLFKERCLRCHSINLQGGDLAPELNTPKNVTEYWSEPDLKAFIYDASSYRLKSKMPIFRGSLSNAEIDAILDYLKLMKQNKSSRQ